MRILRFNIRPVSFQFTKEDVCYCPLFGFIKRAKWQDLRSVFMETTDKGPFVEDQFYVLEYEKCSIRVEQEISGGLLKFLQALPNFNNEEVIRAATSTENARFLLWKKGI